MKQYFIFAVVALLIFSSTAFAKNDNDPLGKIWEALKELQTKIEDSKDQYLYDGNSRNLGKIIDTYVYPSSEVFGQNASYMVYDKTLKTYVLYSVTGEIGVPLRHGIEVDCGDTIVLRNDRDAEDFVYRYNDKLFIRDVSAGSECSSGYGYDISFRQTSIEVPVLPLRVK